MALVKPNGIPDKRELHIFGGSTTEATGANPQSEEIAQRIAELTQIFLPAVDTHLHIVDGSDDDLYKEAYEVASNHSTKIVIWLPDSPRQYEIASLFRQQQVNGMAPRKDLFLVGMSASKGAVGAEQYLQGLEFVKKNSANLALAFDYETGNGMIVAPEETNYDESRDLDSVVRGILEMTYMRSQLTFTRSTVIAGEPVDWNSELVFPALREVVNYLIENGAYKPFLGVTAGHFAAKIDDNKFLTSRRKTNFNNLNSTGLVEVTTDGPDKVVAIGGKPSVGGQSQRIVFEEGPERDCIVHFHCPPKPGSNVPVVSQREFECGSHECGQNTANGLAMLEDGIEAVHLDNHGPNIVFNHNIDPQKVIGFIDKNFDLTRKTGGYQLQTIGLEQ